MGVAKEGRNTGDWIIDSGASKYLTARRELLEDYISIPPTSITIGNGNDITVVGQGNMTLHTE